MPHKIATIFTAIFFISVTLYSQDAGKIYTAEQADQLFGKVVESIKMPTSTVRYWLKKSDNSLMFNIINGKLIVLGDNRELVYSSIDFTDKGEVFHLYSQSKVAEVIEKGRKTATFIEKRSSVLSITNGAFTLETSWPCPPNCN